jgi:hypothetical protein
MKNKLYLLVLLLGGTMTAQKTVVSVYGEKLILNSVVATIPADTDWNTLTIPGLYGVSTVSNNGPTLAVTANLILEVTTDGTNINQKAYNKDGTASQIWMRSRDAATWSPWSRFLNDVDLASLPTAAWLSNGNTATTASNYVGTTDATDFVTKTNGVEHTRITSDGNMGIGVTAPAYKLDVAGTIQGFSSGGGNVSAVIAKGNFATINTAAALDNKWWDFVNSGTALDFRAVNDANTATTSAMIFSRSGTTINNVVFPNGNIGIGSANPSEKLEVTGGNFVVLGTNNVLQIKDTPADVAFTTIANGSSSYINGPLSMQSNKIAALGNGTAATDAINKGQLDGAIATLNTTLATKLVAANIIAGDGITLAVSGNDVTITTTAPYSNSGVVTLTAPWVNDGGLTVARYINTCHISVRIYNGGGGPAIGTQMMTLPDWARPASTRFIPIVISNGTTNAIKIEPNGNVTWMENSTGQGVPLSFSAIYNISN